MAGRDDPGYDPRRREFFRAFGRQTVRSAGSVVAAATELRRAGGDAARELMDLGTMEQVPPIDHGAPERRLTTAESGQAFRSAYRATDDGIVLLDQRDLPGAITMVTVREPSEIASAIRLGVVNAGPVLGEICAYGLAQCVRDAAPSTGGDLASVARMFQAAVATLRDSRHDVRAIGQAVDRVVGRFEALIATGATGGDELAVEMRAGADSIATENALAHSALGKAAAEHFGADGGALNLLMHGDTGRLSGGLVGPGTAVVQDLISAGRPVHVFVTEAAPGMEGTRLLASQLMQLDVPHTVIPDTAVAWLLATRHLDAALIRADYVCANGDTASVVGSLSVAALAERAGVALLTVAPPTAFDPAMPDGQSLAAELRWPATDAAHGAVTVRLEPGTDIVPVALIEGFLTDGGYQPTNTRASG